jgi:murein L,D-transpeptidase YafK
MSSTVFASEIKDKILPPVPDVFVSFGSDQGPEYAIVVEKETQKLFLYTRDGSYREMYRMEASTGKGAGAKLQEGDAKTPEGVYFFITEHKERDLAPIYGSGAFPTDYPNILDRFAGKNGNAIWLHGTNKPLKPRDTNGCIALDNPNLDALTKYITLNRTPIIIVDKISLASVETLAKTKASILSFVSGWNNALSNGSYHDYLKFYAPEFLPDISWWPEWHRIRKSFQASDQSLSAGPSAISIYKHKSIYVVLLDQDVRSAGKETFAGTKKLFISNRGAPLRIIAEEYLAPPDKLKQFQKKNPFMVAFRSLDVVRNVDREIEELIEGWLQAWSSKDIKRYGSYYAKDFRSQGGASLKEWLKYKKGLNKKYNYIRVSKDKLVIKNGRERSTASFIQTYQSNRFKSVSSKSLVLIREDRKWKISREVAEENK